MNMGGAIRQRNISQEQTTDLCENFKVLSVTARPERLFMSLKKINPEIVNRKVTALWQ